MADLTRKQFLAHMRSMLPEFERDHEEHTGVGEQERHSFESWCDELRALYENTRA